MSSRSQAPSASKQAVKNTEAFRRLRAWRKEVAVRVHDDDLDACARVVSRSELWRNVAEQAEFCADLLWQRVKLRHRLEHPGDPAPRAAPFFDLRWLLQDLLLGRVLAETRTVPAATDADRAFLRRLLDGDAPPSSAG